MYASFCSALSVTTKAAPMSSTVQGGGVPFCAVPLVTDVTQQMNMIECVCNRKAAMEAHMTQITATADRHVIVLDRDLVFIAVFCLIGLFASLGLMLSLPTDYVASSLLALMS